MSKQGYVYVMINPSLEGMVKIGRSSRDPQSRAAELSSATGVPTPFYVAYQVFVNDAEYIEKQLHVFFEEKGYKISNNREFFNAPLHEVIELMTRINNGSEDGYLVDKQDNDELEPDCSDLAESLADEAYKYELGSDGYLQDYDEAVKLFKKAAQLGASLAYWKLGCIYMNKYDDNGFKNQKLSMEYYKKGAQAGEAICYAEMALLYLEQGHLANMHKCWNKFVENEVNEHIVAIKAIDMFETLNNLSVPHGSRPDLSSYKEGMLAFQERSLERYEKEGDSRTAEYVKKFIKSLKEYNFGIGRA